MLNQNKSQLLPLPKFLLHFAGNIIFGIVIIIFSLVLGMLGYHIFEKMSWVDAFVNAAMILSGMGPVSTLVTDEGKIFAGCYALFSGLAFIVIIAIVFSPIIHRFFHKIHLESGKG